MHAIAELLIFGLAPLLFGGLVMPQDVADDETTISGEVTARDGTSLPNGAILTVQLAGLSPSDGDEPIVARQTMLVADHVPLNFEMTFDRTAIQPNVNYALQAQVTLNGEILFANESPARFDPVSPGPLSLTLVKSSA